MYIYSLCSYYIKHSISSPQFINLSLLFHLPICHLNLHHISSFSIFFQLHGQSPHEKSNHSLIYPANNMPLSFFARISRILDHSSLSSANHTTPEGVNPFRTGTHFHIYPCLLFVDFARLQKLTWGIK